MRIVLLGLFWFASLYNLGAQPDLKRVDSLKAVLPTLKDDSLRARTLLELSYHLQYSNYSEARTYADQLLTLAVQSNWDWAKSAVYGLQGYLASIRGDHRTALEYDNRRLEFVANDTSRLTTYYNDIGNDYLELGRFGEAFFYISKSKEFSLAKKDGYSLAIASHNLAVLYSMLGRMDLAMKEFEYARKVSAENKDIEGPAYNNHEMGIAHMRFKEYKKARVYFNEALSLSKKLAITTLTPFVYKSLGEYNDSTKAFTTALRYYDSAVRGFMQHQNELEISNANLGKSQVWLKLGNYARADSMASACLVIAQKLQAQTLAFRCTQTLAKIAEHRKDMETAYRYMKLGLQLRDTIESIDVLSQVFENEFKMRSQKLSSEMQNIKKQSEDEVKRQEFIRNIFAVIFALSIVLLYSVYRSGRRKVVMNDLLIQHQSEIEKRSRELEELNKVKDKFFSIISHDLRSPINSLSGLLDLMERDQIKPEELPYLTKEIRAQFTHTKNLINNLLDWTLVQMNKVSIKKENIPLRALIDENIKLLSSLSSKKTIFVNEVDGALTAYADQNMINLVFRNLILNSIKFTGNNGQVRLSATAENKVIRVAVTDNGVGIAPEVQKVLFDKTTGYSTRGTANEKGTGLGLILCKEFIERNGGAISMESEIGKGTTFFITMPQAEA